MRISRISYLLAALLSAQAGLAAAAPQDRAVDQVIVRFKADPVMGAASSTTQRVSALERKIKKINAGIMQRSGPQVSLDHEMTLPDFAVLKLNRPMSEAAFAQFAEQVKASGEVLSIEPDAPVSADFDGQPNDSYLSSQWHLSPSNPRRKTYTPDFPKAWRLSTGEGVVVGIVDTGLAPHNDLGTLAPSGNLVSEGYNFISSCARSGECAPGDSAVVEPRPSALDPGDQCTSADVAYGVCSTTSNSSWHGNHVAGIVGAIANNKRGVAGAAFGSKLLPVRVLGKGKVGRTSDTVAGILWAAGLDSSNPNPHPAKVINASLSGASASCSSIWKQAVGQLLSAGVTLVATAGNDGADAQTRSPANCEGVVTVANLKMDGNMNSSSNYGNRVTIGAPGSDILSITYRDGVNAYDPARIGNYSDYKSGTSMSAPMVASAAALMLSVAPKLTPAQVMQILQETATPFPSDSDCNAKGCGAGMLNAAAAVERAIAVRDTPAYDVPPPPVNQPPAVSLDLPASIEAGASFKVRALAADADSDPLSFAWTLPKGFSGTVGSTSEISLLAPRVDVDTPATFKVTVSDGKHSVDASQSITVKAPVNRPPVAVLNGPAEALSGASIALDASGSSDPDGNALTYKWTAPAAIKLTRNGAKASFNAPFLKEDASYTFTVEASDGKASASSQHTLVVKANRDPVAVLTASSQAEAGETVTFDASASSDADDNALKFTWTVEPELPFTTEGERGDKLVLTAPKGANDASYKVTVRVSDTARYSSRSRTLTVAAPANVPPTGAITAPGTVESGQPLTLHVAAVDADNDPLSYAWQLPEGFAGTAGNQADITVTAPSVKEDTVALFKLTLSDGKDQIALTHPVTVKAAPNNAPLVKLDGPAEATSGAAVELDASGSSDPDGDALTYKWTAPAGIRLTRNGAKASVNAPFLKEDASYTFTVEASDGKASASREHTLVVKANRDPVAVLTAPSQAEAGETVTFDASTSSDADDNPLKFTWAVEPELPFTTEGERGDKLVLTAPKGANDASYKVTVRVSDTARYASRSRTLTVAAPACQAEAAWELGNTYVANNVVQRNGRLYEAQWWTRGEEPGTAAGTGAGKPWKDIGKASCD